MLSLEIIEVALLTKIEDLNFLDIKSIKDLKNDNDALEIARKIIVKNINKAKEEGELNSQKLYTDFYAKNLI